MQRTTIISFNEAIKRQLPISDWSSKDNNENDEYNEGDEEINDCGEDLSSIQ